LINIRDAWRLSVGTFTIFPVSAPRNVHHNVAALAMLFAPFIGLFLGALAALAVFITRTLTPPITGDLLAAAIGISILIWLTRALHLDGLADTADALGSSKPAAEALAIAKRSDIGPFGVVALITVVVVDITALAASTQAHYATLALIMAVATGRLAVVWATVKGIPAATDSGLGASVAGTVPRAAAVGVTLAIITIVLAIAVLVTMVNGDALAWRLIAGSVVALLAGLAAAQWIVRRSIRRLGGITGDVLGAAAEIAMMAALIVMAGATFAA
jgi:adenosylcobinamide-GDP ribazoletransferase